MGEKAPESADVKFALTKFTEDAKIWNDNGDTLGEARATAETLDIDRKAFGVIAGMNVHQNYQDVQQMIVDRLSEGETEFHNIAEALTTARDAYERDEEEAVHKLKQDW